MGEEEIIEEAVELSEAVLSEGRSYFEENYGGELDTYMIVEDIRNRIEVATLDSGEMVYPEDIPGLEELGGEDAARILRDNPLEPGEYRDVFEEHGILEVEDGEVRYTQESFAYFLLFDEAERLIAEDYKGGTGEEGISEGLETDEPAPAEEETREEEEIDQEKADTQEEKVEKSEPKESQDKVEELERIWDEVSSE